MRRPLGPGEVRVLLVDVKSVDAFALAEARLPWLSDDERARYDRLVFPDKKHEFLVTRALARASLAAIAHDAPTALRFDVGPYGRPELAAPPSTLGPLRFNLSNTRGLVACGIAWSRDVGVDVESMDRRTEAARVADRFFAPAEVEALLALPEGDQRRRFFELWTLKEAYIKARGLGLAIPLHSFAFTITEGARPSIAFAPTLVDAPDTWWFEQSFPSHEHAMAVAVRVEPGESIRVEASYCDLFAL